jgi:hypothetical protein
VTKIASVAEEVEDPGRNIPIGILGSITLMMVLYALIVAVIVGVVDPGSITKSLTPMAAAAQAFLGRPGVIAIAITAVLALTGMANAGILSSSRYPLAMSRDRLAPDFLQAVHDRWRTPVAAITVTGTLLLVLIATVPVRELAKLASAFKILVFVFINVALIAMREGSAEWYEPSFRSPLYPWVQIFGIVGGIVLLTQMGVVPFVGAVGLILAGTAWYQFYARDRTTREGVGRAALRRGAQSMRVQEAESELDEPAYEVLVAVSEAVPAERLETLLELAHGVGDTPDAHLRILAFEEVPDQVSLDLAARDQTDEDVAFEERARSVAERMDVDVDVGEVVSHDRRRALRNYVDRHDIDLVIAESDEGGTNSLVSWSFEGHDDQPVNTILFRPGHRPGWPELEVVDVVAGQGALDPLKVRIANTLATNAGATIRFLLTAEGDVSEQQEAALRAHGEDLADLCEVPTESHVLRVDEDWTEVPDAVADASLVIGSRRVRGFATGIEDIDSDHLARIDAPLLVVDSGDREASLLRRLTERLAY